MELSIKKVSDYSKSALKYAVNFAKSFGADITLIYVVEPIIYPPDFSMGQIAIPAVNTEWDQVAQEELTKLAKNEISSEVNLLLKLLKLLLMKILILL